MRLEGWEARTNNILRKKMRAVFSWEDNNCVFFVCEIVYAITGRNLLESLKSSFSTRQGAARELKNQGCSNLKELVGKFFRVRPRAKIMRGDICLLKEPQTGDYLLGCYFAGFAYALSAKGMHKFPLCRVIEIYGVD